MDRGGGERRLGGQPFRLTSIPDLESVWLEDLTDPDPETQHGELYNHPDYDHATIDPSGIGGISPTWTVTCPTYPPDYPAGVDRRWYIPDMPGDLGVLDEAYLRYKVYIPADFDYGGGGKMPGLAGKSADETVFDLAWGGNRPGDSWSSRVLFGSAGNTSYLYAEQPVAPNYPYGMGGQWTGGFTLGAWNEVLMHVAMNTPGVADGTFRLWVNDLMAYDGSGVMEWRTEAAPDIGVSVVAFNWGYGGALTDGPATPQTLHFAEFELLVPA